MKNLILVILIITLTPVYLFADVVVEWNPNQSADYHVVYWGETSGNYTDNSENIPADTTEFLIPNPDNKNIFFSVKAFNSCGNSSDFADEVSYSCDDVPVTIGLKVKANTTININIQQ